MKYKNKQAFTLVEMMIVIALLFMLLTFAYLPYAHYQEKLKVRQVIREASQTILWSRNLAVNGYDDDSSGSFENRALWVYFTKNDKINSQIFSYSKDHEFSENDLVNLIQASGKIHQTRKLHTWTQFEWVANKTGESTFALDTSVEWILFYYHPITGESEYYTSNGNILTKIEADKIFLEFSYKWSDSPVLRKILQYDTRVHIIDYGKWVTEL